MKINRFYAIILFLAFMAGPARAQDALRWFWSPGLAIYASSINESLNQDLKLGYDKGFLVLAVARSGVGNQVGIKPGDIIVGFSSNEMWTESGKSGTLQVLRDGTELTLSATTSKLPDDAPIDLIRATPVRQSDTFVIDPQGSGNFRTITGALFRAIAGDTIVLKPAVYSESVLVTGGVRIRAEEHSIARVETKTPWLAVANATLDVRSISFSGAGLVIEESNNVTVSECSFVIPEKQTGLVITNTKGAKISHGSFNGAAQTTGVSSSGSQITITDSFFSGQGTAILLRRGTRADLRTSVLDSAESGVLAFDSELVGSKDLVTGNWDPKKKDASDFGIRLEKSTLNFTKSSIRGHRYGVFIIDAPRPAIIGGTTVTQGQEGILFLSSSGTVSDSLIIQNLGDGIYISKSQKDVASDPKNVELIRNTISQNEGDGISVADFSHVAIRENLIEANGGGIRLQHAGATVENNTIVLQHYSGVFVAAKSDVKIYNNIVAFNSFGLFIDVAGRRDTACNDVYGNLASTEFPLIDGNYGRTDRYTTVDGKKVPIDVYPAYDLKSETDLNVDPGFVKLGTDYNLNPSSALATVRGRDQRYLGAFAPSVSLGARPRLAGEESSGIGGRSGLSKRASAAARAKERNANTPRKPTQPAGSNAFAESDKYIDRGDEYMVRSNWDEAIAAYKQAIVLAPNNADAYYSLGWAYNQMGRHGEAFAPFVKAIQLDSQYAEAHFGIGYAYLHSDNYPKAIPFLRTAIKLDPDNPEAYYCLGQAYLGMGDKKAALEEYGILKDLDAKMAQDLLKEIEK
jgi:nitrous oxidase accessory protein NosD